MNELEELIEYLLIGPIIWASKDIRRVCAFVVVVLLVIWLVMYVNGVS